MKNEQLRANHEYNFVLMMDLDYDKEEIRRLATRLEDDFGVKTTTVVEKDLYFEDGAYAIHMMTNFVTYAKMRHYLTALGYDEEGGYAWFVQYAFRNWYEQL